MERPHARLLQEQVAGPLQKRPPLAILIAVTAVGPAALNVFLPSMPGLQRAFDTDYATVQLCLTLYLVGLAVAQLVYGPLSDRFGRRPVLLAGLSVFLAGSLACVLAPNIWMLIGGRVVQAVGGCAGVVIGRAIVRDLYERERAASMLAYITMAMVVAPMLAPTIGGFLDVWFGWRAGFVFLIGFGGIVLAAALVCLHETHHPRARPATAGGPLTGAGRLLASRAFQGYAVHLAFTTGLFIAFIGSAPYVMVELMGRPPSEYGLYFMTAAASYMAANFIAGRISPRFGVDRMIAVGATICLVGAVGLALATVVSTLDPVTLFVWVAIMSFGQGLSIPNGIAGAISVDPRRVGTAAGISGFLQMAVGAGLSYLVGALLADTPAPMVAVMLAAAMVASLAHVWGSGWPWRLWSGGGR